MGESKGKPDFQTSSGMGGSFAVATDAGSVGGAVSRDPVGEFLYPVYDNVEFKLAIRGG